MKLVYWPNPVLKQVSADVAEAPTPELIAQMRAVMRAHNGAGLSAIQVGIAQKIILVDNAPGHCVFINLKINEHLGNKTPMLEGCLSVPGFYELVERFQGVKVSFQDEAMVLHESVEFWGVPAHVLQHEEEHARGKMFLEHLTAAKRSAILGNMQKLKKAGKLK